MSPQVWDFIPNKTSLGGNLPFFLKTHKKWKSCNDDDVQVVFGKLDQAASMFEVEESLQRLQCSILLIDGFGVVIMKLI